jgi:hypothetical protein
VELDGLKNYRSPDVVYDVATPIFKGCAAQAYLRVGA